MPKTDRNSGNGSQSGLSLYSFILGIAGGMAASLLSRLRKIFLLVDDVAMSLAEICSILRDSYEACVSKNRVAIKLKLSVEELLK
jgi:hypothetical protein